MNTSFGFLAGCKRVIIGALLVIPMLLVACSSVRLGYSQAPSLAYWWLDGYVDLTEAQSPLLREDLNAWFDWHQRTQLPEYAALLARARAEVQEPVTAAQLCRWNGLAVQRLELAYNQFVPALARLAISMTPAQIDHLERRFAKAQAVAKDDFQRGNAEQRLKAVTDRTQSRATLLFGTLNEAQRERIARSAADAPISTALWLEERSARQQDLVQTLGRLSALAASDKARALNEAQTSLRALAVVWQRSPREPYRALQQRSIKHKCQLAADLVNLSTPEQRLSAVEKLRRWEEDARALMSP